MQDTQLIPPMGEGAIAVKFKQFIRSVLDEQILLDELAEFIWKSTQRYGRGFYIRQFSSLPNGSYFDEVKLSGQMVGFYVDSSLIPKQGERFKTEFDQLLSAYDPQKEFVIAAIAKIEHKIHFDGIVIAYPERLFQNWLAQKAKLSRTQIKKRLRRMIQAGRKLLILDTEVPEIKENLDVWLEEAKKLPLSVIIKSENEQDSLFQKSRLDQVLMSQCK